MTETDAMESLQEMDDDLDEVRVIHTIRVDADGVQPQLNIKKIASLVFPCALE